MPLTTAEIAEAITILRKIMPSQTDCNRLTDLAAKFRAGSNSEDQKLAGWRRRSAAAKRAVETKRRKYSTWPTRRNDHHLKGEIKS